MINSVQNHLSIRFYWSKIRIVFHYIWELHNPITDSGFFYLCFFTTHEEAVNSCDSCDITFPEMKPLSQTVLDVLCFKAVDDGVDSSRQQTVQHHHCNTHWSTKMKPNIIGQVHKTSGYVEERSDEDLRRAGGQSPAPTTGARRTHHNDNHSEEGEDDEAQRHQQTEQGETECYDLNFVDVLTAQSCYGYVVTVALHDDVGITVRQHERINNQAHHPHWRDEPGYPTEHRNCGVGEDHRVTQRSTNGDETVQSHHHQNEGVSGS